MQYEIYVLDTETNSLLIPEGDIIELSILRLSSEEQKTWFIKPINIESTDPASLRINGHKLEDLKGETKHGRETYQEASKVIVEVENWLAEDNLPSENRVICAFNSHFDKGMLENLWKKLGASSSYPWGRRYIDPMGLAFAMDYIQGTFADSYSLSATIKKYAIKNAKAHSAESDVQATKELFLKQIEDFRKKMGIKIVL